ncbi:MAG: hypothetical protein R2705_16915 [Ilumatobacteraceae bacterium]
MGELFERWDLDESGRSAGGAWQRPDRGHGGGDARRATVWVLLARRPDEFERSSVLGEVSQLVGRVLAPAAARSS